MAYGKSSLDPLVLYKQNSYLLPIFPALRARCDADLVNERDGVCGAALQLYVCAELADFRNIYAASPQAGCQPPAPYV